MNNLSFQKLKKEHRLLLKKQISGLSSTDREAKSQNINIHLKQKLRDAKGPWGAFDSLPSEPVIQWSELNPHIRWYFVEVSNQSLVFKNESEVVDAQALQGICIPALGFNFNGARLGRGGGFYDRALIDYNGIKIGISYDFAVSEDRPFETHDVKVDVIVTDRRIVDAA